MTTRTGWSRVRVMFHAALEQPVETRTAFLSDACAGDTALQREVESLLAAEAAAGGFLDTPALRLEQRDRSPARALETGARVGDFDVVELLGAGGMGEVYRARDGRLGRDVAIKVLPLEFAADPQRLARFERESRILASLNHPNIATIHDIAHAGGIRLLVLELVEGPTLAERLPQGSLPVADALDIARQLAEALDAAHERGIVHRDLKPANVKLSTSGRVVLLDFGLAKDRVAVRIEGDAPSDAASGVSAGLVLGTVGYMSPEQARGQSVDKRTDIWAFGCVLFELVSGTRAFCGDTPSDTLAAIIERQPDWRRLPDTLPTNIRALLRRCLEKDPHRRLHDIADARIEIEDALAPHPSAPRLLTLQRRTVTRAAIVAALVAGCIALGWWLRDLWPAGSPGERVTRFTWAIPAGMRLDSPAAVSPDGQQIAFTASLDDGAPPRLYVRPLAALDALAIPRTEGARQPFWSPDSRTVAYFANGKLFKVAVESGVPVEIGRAPEPRGGAWGSAGIIVFAPGSIYAGLSRVAANGGAAEPVTLVDTARGDNSHRWPVFLPDGVHFVYFVRSMSADRRGVYLGRIDRPAAPSPEPLFRSESEAVYVPLAQNGPGVLLSAANDHIDVHPFDARRLALTGEPTTMPLAVGGNTPHHAAMLSGTAGLLTHVASAMPYGQRLMSSTRAGEQSTLGDKRSIVNWPRVSPDGKRLVIQEVDAVTGSPDLWVEDLDRHTRLRITPPGTSGQLPVWSPNGRQVAYVAGTFEKPIVTIAAADGTGVVSTLPCPHFRCEPSDWTRDGRWLLVTTLDKGTADVWMLPTTTDAASRPLLTAPFVERDARLSPDGRFVAYVSEESGRPEISVRTVDSPLQREVVSAGGGTQPVWSRGGPELLFVDLEGILRSTIVGRTTGGRPLVGSASRLDIPPIGTGHYGTQYDLSPDGRRVYFLDRQLTEPPRDIGLILGWRNLLR